MKLRNIVMCCLLIITSFFCFAGCADIEMIRLVGEDNVIVDKFVITLDKSKLDKCPSASFQSVSTAIHEDLIAFRNYVDEWKLSFKDDHPEVYIAIDSNITCQVPPINKNELSLILEFSNWTFFGLFYGMSTEGDVEYQRAMDDVGPFIEQIVNQEYSTEEMGLFLYKYSMLKDDGVLKSENGFKIDEIGIDYLEKYSAMTNYTIDSINLTQIFGYPDDRLYSNADEKEVLGNMTFLAWNLSDKPEDFEMVIYKLAPRAVSWYLLGLILSVAFVIAMFVVFNVKYKKAVTIKVTKQEVEKDEKR